MRLALDLDGVVCDLYTGLFGVAGIPLSKYKDIEAYDFKPVLDFKSVWEKVRDDENFWLSAPVMDGYIPSSCVAYISARYCPREVTEKWLYVHGLYTIPLVQVKTPEEKTQALRGLAATGLVDDRGETYLEVKDEFPHSFLVSRPWNRWVSTPNRIYKLEELNWRIPH